MIKVKLIDVAEEIRTTKKEIEKDTPIVGLEHLEPENINLSKWDKNIKTTFTKTFCENDILFGRRRAYLRKAAVAPCSGVCSGDITVIRAKQNKIFEKLLPYVIQNPEFFDFAVTNSDGSLSPRVKWEHLKEFTFYLPDIEKQKDMALLLNELENLKQIYQNELLKSQNYLHAFFNSIKFDESTSLKEIIKLMPKSKIKAGEAIKDGKYVFFTSSEQQQHIDKYIYNDELIVLGTGGVASINYYNGQFSVSTDNFSFKSNDNKFLTKFIYYYLRANRDIVELGFKGSGMKHLSKEYLFSIKIPQISIEEQNDFLLLCEKIENANRIIAEKISNVDDIQKSITKPLFRCEED